jgi:hypothetical protein
VGRGRRSTRGQAGTALAAAFLLLAAGAAGSSGEGPVPPCGAAPVPAYGAPGAAPEVAAWHEGKVDPAWRPADCLGWEEPGFTLMVALAGRFADAADSTAMLARFGAVSHLPGIRYWSVTDGRWQELVRAATALDGPDPARRRGDFRAEEMLGGGDLYFAERDNRATNEVVYRLRLREATPDRLVIEIENVSAVRWYLLTLFAAGELRTVFFLERSGPGAWRYYSLMRIGPGASGAQYEKSYINRAAAFFRHVAGIPTDQAPPAAR